MTFKGINLDFKTATRIADHYPAGTEVDVYYDPQRPQRAVLEPGAAEVRQSAVAILLAVVFIAIGLGFISRLIHSLLAGS